MKSIVFSSAKTMLSNANIVKLYKDAFTQLGALISIDIDRNNLSNENPIIQSGEFNHIETYQKGTWNKLTTMSSGVLYEACVSQVNDWIYNFTTHIGLGYAAFFSQIGYAHVSFQNQEKYINPSPGIHIGLENFIIQNQKGAGNVVLFNRTS